ncbi:DinB family protein [Saprospiraceae bacterium]|nr:DinB family protein [Saprospiraceae bacterium]
MITRPTTSEFPEFQQKYIALVPDDVIPYLREQKSRFLNYIDNVKTEQLDHRYAEGKWSIREVIMHIVDTEQVFAYRTLAVSRGDSQNLSGFDQNVYIAEFDSSHLNQEYMSRFFSTTRDTFMVLTEGMRDSDWNKVGKMSNYDMILSAMPYMIAGHLEHHLNILKEKY